MSGINIDDLREGLDRVFRTMQWAEEEIEAAQRRHPDAAERIWRSFALLRPTLELIRTELVYRSHCRELLARVARGEDTRPGTAAECCVALSETSLRVPLSTSAAGLYARMWRLAQLPPGELADASGHYEALEGSLIDEHEFVMLIEHHYVHNFQHQWLSRAHRWRLFVSFFEHQRVERPGADVRGPRVWWTT